MEKIQQKSEMNQLIGEVEDLKTHLNMNRITVSLWVLGGVGTRVFYRIDRF